MTTQSVTDERTVTTGLCTESAEYSGDYQFWKLVWNTPVNTVYLYTDEWLDYVSRKTEVKK